MNVVLSCYANKGKGAFILEKGGRVIRKEVFPLRKDGKELLKEYIFEAIIKGLRYARNHVNHDDLLLVGVQNTHAAEWLNGSREYKGYEVYLDEISEIIETLDCRYLFSNVARNKAKKVLEEGTVEVKLEGASDVFSGL